MKRVILMFTMFLAVSLFTASCEDEESATQFSINDTFDEVRNGVRLILYFDAQSSTFVGSIENTTDKAISKIRVEVHLSNGTELGPTANTDLAPGEIKNVSLPAISENFETWGAHAEVG
ncbi:MAG: hypothetical protein HN778_10700 [Prolixibacteraceae bacterium]|jgi:hypothetical protein|nr:hypothetical protein [Prolixibacteraceae bacterium]MBT6006729.1 hypothetical protein [Prolixibacteraceae bacterium]MBT6764756.1 hypothetical protein [Prolixibacteraceae bacterium]MBT6996827.1 hypothetical protein [Prolixibacteraceae bacterium]MBT7395290.1 hypothetical protein [Prolixibacteraceae bacterium]